jgi:hypothetical protein
MTGTCRCHVVAALENATALIEILVLCILSFLVNIMLFTSTFCFLPDSLKDL